MSMDFPGIFFINYSNKFPHMSGGLKGPVSPLQELKVGGRRPPYLLVFYIRFIFTTIHPSLTLGPD